MLVILAPAIQFSEQVGLGLVIRKERVDDEVALAIIGHQAVLLAAVWVATMGKIRKIKQRGVDIWKSFDKAHRSYVYIIALPCKLFIFKYVGSSPCRLNLITILTQSLPYPQCQPVSDFFLTSSQPKTGVRNRTTHLVAHGLSFW